VGRSAALTHPERRRAVALAAVIAALHGVGLFILLVLVVPKHFSLGGSGIFGLGMGLTAYLLGLRHAFDADHICAIDNTTRKLMADGKRPLSVGFFFSLGHSSVVLGLVLLLTLGAHALVGPITHGTSEFHLVAGVIGTAVSGAFLYLIAGLNLVVLIRILRAVGRLRQTRDERASYLPPELGAGGAMSQLYGPLTRAVRHPAQMYPIGFLFGLGFDTATEVALLFVAAGAAWSRLPFYAVLCLPILFAAGMSLLDTLDGCFMTFAYGWAFTSQARKVYFNITITSLSVLVALAVGTIELLSVLADRLGLTGGAWHVVTTINLNELGVLVVALFVLTWVVALLIWQVADIEERWAMPQQLGDQRR
jgi:nickel/cobalt transporter (NiCoT) family protein